MHLAYNGIVGRKTITITKRKEEVVSFSPDLKHDHRTIEAYYEGV